MTRSSAAQQSRLDESVGVESTVADASLNALMVFDGVCNFCSGYVQLVIKMDRACAIRFTAVQSPYGRLLCQRQGVDPDDTSTFLFFDRGRAFEASDAMVAMFGRLPTPWRWLRYLKFIPKPVRDGVYRWIARNRYSLFGKRRTCMIPSAAVRARFIDTDPATSS